MSRWYVRRLFGSKKLKKSARLVLQDFTVQREQVFLNLVKKDFTARRTLLSQFLAREVSIVLLNPRLTQNAQKETTALILVQTTINHALLATIVKQVLKAQLLVLLDMCKVEVDRIIILREAVLNVIQVNTLLATTSVDHAKKVTIVREELHQKGQLICLLKMELCVQQVTTAQQRHHSQCHALLELSVQQKAKLNLIASHALRTLLIISLVKLSASSVVDLQLVSLEVPNVDVSV